MTMLQVFVQVVSVALVLCKQYTILNRMVKAAQLTLGGFFIIVFRLVRDVVANHKTTRYAGAATKVIQKITLLKYNVGVQAALYAKEM